MKDLVKAYEQIMAFTHIKPSVELREHVEVQAEKQRQYQRKHDVKPLAAFGIEEKRIAEDFAFILGSAPFSDAMNSNQ